MDPRGNFHGEGMKEYDVELSEHGREGYFCFFSPKYSIANVLLISIHYKLTEEFSVFWYDSSYLFTLQV